MTLTLTDWVLLFCSIKRDLIEDQSYFVVRETGCDSNRTLYVRQFASGVTAEYFAALLTSEFKRRGLSSHQTTRSQNASGYEMLEFTYFDSGAVFNPFHFCS